MENRNILFAAIVGLLVALTPALAGSEGRGKQLYQLCTQCHAADATGNPAVGAPAIAGLGQWYIEAQLEKFKTGYRGRHPEDLPGMRMRPMALTLLGEGDVEAVAGYVAGLSPNKPEQTLDAGDITRGSEHFKVCLACHGPEAAGNQQMNAPRLALANDWYLLAQLQNFREGRRGVDPGDASGLQMRAMALTLPDDQALVDVVSYIMTLADGSSE
ncbi:MAG: c-type cytochrome [bacterium]|nr:c-type cytochrome [bacterium]